jgi:hypothetical protein
VKAAISPSARIKEVVDAGQYVVSTLLPLVRSSRHVVEQQLQELNGE